MAPLSRFALCGIVALSTVASPARATTPAGPYHLAPAWGGVTFESPVEILFAPGESHRLFVVERAGRIAVVRDRAAPVREVFLDLTTVVGATANDTGLLSMAFHPEFATNGQFFLWYSMIDDGQFSLRLGRFTVDDPTDGVAHVASEIPLITRPSAANSHDGGQLAFGPEGYLYLSIGDSDAHTNPATAAQRQLIDRGFYGVVLRIDVDQQPTNLRPHDHPSVHPDTYRIPADNPFVDVTSYHGETLQPIDVRTEIYALGLRNPFRLSFDPANGDLWVADVGLDAVEELNLITAGGNYGWPWLEGTVAGPAPQPATITTPLIAPVWSYRHTGQRSITGGHVYRGTKFPELIGSYLAADLVTGRVFSVFGLPTPTLDGAAAVDLTNDDFIVDFTTDPLTGDILIADLFDGPLKALTRSAPPTGLVNLSSRAPVGTGDNVLVPSFVITDGPKQVLIRAVGPTLGRAPFDLPDAIPFPGLALMRDGVQIAANSNWNDAPNAPAIGVASAVAGAFPLITQSPDAALLITLEPGAYTVVTRDLSATAGIALVEVYDLDPATSPSRLVNLAVRSQVGTGNSALTSGFVVTGTKARSVLIRAIGPGLAEFSIENPLADPILRLYHEAELIATNQNWMTHANRDAVASTAQHLGAFALDPLQADSALLLSLPPGVYTAQAVSASDQTGLALLEVYLVP